MLRPSVCLPSLCPRPSSLQMLQQLCGGLSNDVPVELVRGVLDLRQRAAIALGNIIADYPAPQLAGEEEESAAEGRSMRTSRTCG